jgi:hypothetical protein
MNQSEAGNSGIKCSSKSREVLLPQGLRTAMVSATQERITVSFLYHFSFFLGDIRLMNL